MTIKLSKLEVRLLQAKNRSVPKDSLPKVLGVSEAEAEAAQKSVLRKFGTSKIFEAVDLAREQGLI